MKKIRPGLYKHYKGKNYEVLGNAHHSETLDEVIVYKALYEHEDFGKNALWVRPAKMFGEKILINSKRKDRFVFEKEILPAPQVGVGVIIKKGNTILLGMRKGKHGENTWSVPGGKLNYGESIEDCAMREALEETGITIKNPHIITITNDIFKNEKKHFVTIWVEARYKKGNLRVTEPDKFVDTDWFDGINLPSPLFLPLKNLLRNGFKVSS